MYCKVSSATVANICALFGVKVSSWKECVDIIVAELVLVVVISLVEDAVVVVIVTVVGQTFGRFLATNC